jgi:hypothetical protein
VRDSQLVAKACDHFRFGASFGAKAVVDRGRFDAAGSRSCSEEEQREAVGASGYGNADALVRRD